MKHLPWERSSLQTSRCVDKHFKIGAFGVTPRKFGKEQIPKYFTMTVIRGVFLANKTTEERKAREKSRSICSQMSQLLPSFM